MHDLIRSLARRLETLVPPRRLLIAVSGGADSMALLRGVLELQTRFSLELQVGHLDHQLRGAESAADAAWLARECQMLQVPCTIGQADVAARAAASGLGVEEAARVERYAFLAETARVTGCPVIALAHTADDQIETILHHILRGTGLAGLRGIPATRELAPGLSLLRPLLEVGRADVLDYLRQLGQSYREDATNCDEVYTRNRIRRQLLPSLARDYNPQIGESLLRLADQAAAAQEALEFVADGLLERVLVSSSRPECRLKWQPLTGYPCHLVREMFALLWRRQNWPRQQMSFAHWSELERLLREGGAATFPGRIDVRRDGRWIILRQGAAGPDL